MFCDAFFTQSMFGFVTPYEVATIFGCDDVDEQ